MNQGLLIAGISALASVLVVMLANRGKLKTSNTETATVLSGQLFTQLTALTEESRKTREELAESRGTVLKLTEEVYSVNRVKAEQADEIADLKERIIALEKQIVDMKSDNDSLNRFITQHWGNVPKP